MDKLRVLLVHNHYQQSGGEDVVYEAEKGLLENYAHEVAKHVDTNDRISELGPLRAARETIWSVSTYQKMKKILKSFRPDVVHFHNTFLMISPSAYYACHEIGAPVVQTLHNYRLLCPVALLYRDGSICEECLGKPFAWPGIQHRCYHDSRLQTTAVAMMLSIHRSLQTWRDKVNIYIALTEFSRRKFIEGGLPPEKIAVKPNFISHASGIRQGMKGEYVLYLGRLSPEKGLDDLLRAWEDKVAFPLKIAGDGPLRNKAEEFAERHEFVQYLGQQDRSVVQDLLRSARFVVVPSVCYENFPMIIAEAFSYGVPVVAARLGAMKELIRDGELGLFFNPGDPSDLAAKVRWIWDHPEEATRMGQNARREYEKKYTPEKNYQMLMGIYAKVLAGNVK